LDTWRDSNCTVRNGDRGRWGDVSTNSSDVVREQSGVARVPVAGAVCDSGQSIHGIAFTEFPLRPNDSGELHPLLTRGEYTPMGHVTVFWPRSLRSINAGLLENESIVLTLRRSVLHAMATHVVFCDIQSLLLLVFGNGPFFVCIVREQAPSFLGTSADAWMLPSCGFLLYSLSLFAEIHPS